MILTTTQQAIADAGRLRIEALYDGVVEAMGHDPRSAYAEQYWLPVIGPGSLMCARSLVTGLETTPAGYEIDVALLGCSLGLTGKGGRSSTVVRTLTRLTQFGLARFHPAQALYRVRLAWPPLTQRQLARLPDFLVELHSAA